MICSKCKKGFTEKNKAVRCTELYTNMKPECVQKHCLFSLIRLKSILEISVANSAIVQQKIFKMLSDMQNKTDEGEEWKNN